MLSKSQYNFGKARLLETAKRWKVSATKVAQILSDIIYYENIWQWCNIEDFLTEFQDNQHNQYKKEKKHTIKIKQSYMPIEFIKYLTPDWLYRKFSNKLHIPIKYKIKTTFGTVRFRGYFCRYLETTNWHYYEISRGEIIHFRKNHLIYVKGGSAAEVSKNKY